MLLVGNHQTTTTRLRRLFLLGAGLFVLALLALIESLSRCATAPTDVWKTWAAIGSICGNVLIPFGLGMTLWSSLALRRRVALKFSLRGILVAATLAAIVVAAMARVAPQLRRVSIHFVPSLTDITVWTDNTWYWESNASDTGLAGDTPLMVFTAWKLLLAFCLPRLCWLLRQLLHQRVKYPGRIAGSGSRASGTPNC